MPKWAPIVLALALASATPLEAAEVGSTELVRQCKYPRQGKRTIDENADALQCLSYIDGFVAGASIVAGPRSDRNDVGPGGGRLSGLGRQARRHVGATEIRHLATRVRRGVSLPEIGG
jgi:hypothetical protein